MTDTTSHALVTKLDRLRAELIELAYSLECRGQVEAADVAMTTSARIEELREEIETDGEAQPRHPVR